RARCLAHRCTEAFRKIRGRAESEPTFTSFADAVRFTRALSSAEGVRIDELDALLSNPPGQSGVETSDPLAEMAWEYAERLTALLAPVALQWSMESRRPRPGGPTATETVLWYHLRIYMRVFRALVARDNHRDGAGSEEARGCAKLALLSIDRSLAALANLDDLFAPDDRCDLQAMLTQLRDGLEARVPAARAYLRIGLDEPAARV